MSTSPQPAPGVPTCYRHPGREAYIRCQRCNRPICPDCMNAASVGFQCPECVREGRATQRAARTTYGGLRPTDASFTTLVLIALNAVVWLLINLTGGNGSRLLNWLELRPRGVCLDQFGRGFLAQGLSCRPGETILPGVDGGAYWQLVTSGFTHVAIWHIASNMFFLYLVGPQLETLFGRMRFLALYFISMLAGSALVYWAAPEYQSAIGASGAIFGLMAALLVVSVKRHADLRQILVLIAINFAITFAISGISWQAHVGGFVGGALTAGVLAYAPAGPRRTPVQAGGLLCLAVVVVLLIAARSLVLA
ncbi:rhomboid family intramembrane serine protease [Nocardioides sp. DS6]|uniref:Rhomboid family intramembrane serine protease n=1 Tax=Nocardioides eburneus TaxID=3231482 RepID=A0ABV3T240_9ACTN